MYHKSIFVFISFCFLSGALHSQEAPSMRLLDVKDGLSHRDVKFATRDSRGFLWIMDSGIDSYDGQNIIAYNKFDPDHYIPVSGIQSGCQLEDSLLLFHESTKLYALNMRTGKYRPYPFPKGMKMDSNSLVMIADRQHHPDILLFTKSLTGTIIYVIDRHWNFQFAYEVGYQDPMQGYIYRAYSNGPEGVLWLMDQTHHQILRIDREEKKVFDFTIPKEKEKSIIRIIYMDGVGLVICRDDGLISLLREGTNKIEDVMQLPISTNQLNPIHIDSKGWIWSIGEKEVVRFNLQLKEYQVRDIRPFGKLYPTLHSSFEDKEGIIWISTDVGLLKILPDPKPFNAYFVQSDTSRNFQIRDILPASPNSVYCRAFDQKIEMVEVRLSNDMSVDTTIHSHEINKQGMFVRNKDYLYRVVTAKKMLERIHLPDFYRETLELPVQSNPQYFNLFVVDSTGMIFYQDRNNQLTGFDPETHLTQTITLEGISGQVNSAWRTLSFFGKNTILIGTESKGLYVFDRNTGKQIRNFNTESPHPLSGNFINVVLPESDSIIWIGTLGAGVNRINIEQGTVGIFTSLDGLANNLVASMVLDQRGNIWIGTYGGLSMYSQADHQFYNYTTADGLSDIEFNYRASYQSPEGIIYMGTLNGLTVFHPEKILGKAFLPPVLLTRIQTYNRRKDEVVTLDQGLDESQVIEITPYDNYIDLQFAVPSFKQNESHIFFSRLSGIESEWQNLGRRPSIRYQHLQPGHYRLELMATDANGNKTIHPTLLNLHVQQVYYKSAWFLGLSACCILLMMYSLYRYRLRMIQKEHQTRTRIASDLHDEVGGSLTGLFLQMQMMELS
ncbi:MAG TPA: two-component regulator propeller domain-containing protein, partial [Saprospiraceae bacterium]|nr:two-component regulator propeller domain-containing protein [Saprospiraceae bacterium]